MIFDLHNDYPTAYKRRDYSEYIRSCADNSVVAAIWTSELVCPVDFIDVTAARLTRLNVPVAIEDMSFSDGGSYTDFDFSRFVYCSLTWNKQNRFAGGALDDGKLTSEGERAIKRINGKCALDLAHIGRSAFYKALDCAENPICSHTGVADHPRCIDGGQIKALVGRNALIGLSAVRAFSGASGAIEFAHVLDNFVQRYGNDCLCIGTDFCGSSDFPDDLCEYAHFDTVARELMRRGYTQHDIDKIFYLNAKRFCEETV